MFLSEWPRIAFASDLFGAARCDAFWGNQNFPLREAFCSCAAPPVDSPGALAAAGLTRDMRVWLWGDSTSRNADKVFKAMAGFAADRGAPEVEREYADRVVAPTRAALAAYAANPARGRDRTTLHDVFHGSLERPVEGAAASIAWHGPSYNGLARAVASINGSHLRNASLRSTVYLINDGVHYLHQVRARGGVRSDARRHAPRGNLPLANRPQTLRQRRPKHAARRPKATGSTKRRESAPGSGRSGRTSKAIAQTSRTPSTRSCAAR